MTANQAMTGQFTATSLPSLLQYLGTTNAHGQLQLRQSLRSASLVFEQGRLVNARHGTAFGQDAVNLICQWADGNYRFVEGNTEHDHSINASLTSVLMDAALHLDNKALRQTASNPIRNNRGSTTNPAHLEQALQFTLEVLGPIGRVMFRNQLSKLDNQPEQLLAADFKKLLANIVVAVSSSVPTKGAELSERFKTIGDK